jgi:hypothetical protein
MPRVGFEATIAASKRAKTVHALDYSATVTGIMYACISGILLRRQKTRGHKIPVLTPVSLLCDQPSDDAPDLKIDHVVTCCVAIAVSHFGYDGLYGAVVKWWLSWRTIKTKRGKYYSGILLTTKLTWSHPRSNMCLRSEKQTPFCRIIILELGLGSAPLYYRHCTSSGIQARG